MSSAFGKEQVAFFEIDQPFCIKTYGQTTSVGTCSAVLGTTGQHKCYNTRVTCQAPNDYNATNSVVVLRFCRSQEGLLKFGPLIPSIDQGGITTTPASLNLGGMDRNSGPLGQREVVTVKFIDHRYSDNLVDKYRLERRSGAASSPSAPFDPYTQGTFWSKWRARNPYYANYRCRHRIGTMDQTLDQMMVRNYLLNTMSGPEPDTGQVTIVAKDLFSKIEIQKAVAPKASRGALSADMTGSPGTFTLTPAGIGNSDYDTSGHVAIGDEIIQYTRVSDVCTVVARAQLNTIQADHKQEDLVQQVLSYVSSRAENIVYDLLIRFGSMVDADLDRPGWIAAMSSVSSVYTGRIAEPTPLLDLIGELSEQVGFTVWHDSVSNKVRMTALRATTPSAAVDDSMIVDRSLTAKTMDSARASQVWVYYGMINPKADVEDRRNYRSRHVSPDLGSEGTDKYGTPAIRERFSRWIPQFGRTLAKDCADRLLGIFVDPPVEVKFRLHYGQEGLLDLTRFFTLETAEIQDFIGLPSVLTMATTELEREDNELTVQAQSIHLTPPVPSAERVIPIEVNAYELNLRDIYDSIYSAPAGGEIVRFQVIGGVKVGSTTTSVPSMRTGLWPASVVLYLDLLSGGRVEGKAGSGAIGGNFDQNGSAGAPGGDAILAEHPITINNAGQIWAGAGGGGGGGGLFESSGRGSGGGGGGGGTGFDGGSGNSGGTVGFDPTYSGQPGSPGGSEGPGAGGSSPFTQTGTRRGGYGGTGGVPGSAGSNGEDAQSDAFVFRGIGGAGGAPGKYINGNSFVTWVTTGDRRGSVA